MKSIQVTEEHYSFLATLQAKAIRSRDTNIFKYLSITDFELLKEFVLAIDFGDNPETLYDYLDDDQINELFDEVTGKKDMGLGKDEVDQLMSQWGGKC